MSGPTTTQASPPSPSLVAVTVSETELTAIVPEQRQDSGRPDWELGQGKGTKGGVPVDRVLSMSDMSETTEDERIRLEQEAERLDELRKQKLYGSRALWCMPYGHPLRMKLVKIIESRWFSMVSLLVIIVNSAFIAAEDPLQGRNSSRNKFINDSEIVFTSLFTIEMFLIIGAKGFAMHEYAYLRDAWNWLDFVIVITGWLTLLPGLDGASAVSSLKTLRVLRPLKTIKTVKGMRVVVSALLAAIPMFLNVSILWLFAVVIFGIVGIQLFAGLLRQQCEDPVTMTFPERFNNTFNNDRLCSLVTVSGRQCASNLRCVDSGVNPNYGITHFDNIAAAFLTLFQCITLEGWVDVMYDTQDATSDWAILYYLILILFCSFFIVNLALAVIYAKFAKMSEQEDQLAADALAVIEAKKAAALKRAAEKRKREIARASRTSSRKHLTKRNLVQRADSTPALTRHGSNPNVSPQRKSPNPVHTRSASTIRPQHIARASLDSKLAEQKKQEANREPVVAKPESNPGALDTKSTTASTAPAPGPIAKSSSNTFIPRKPVAGGQDGGDNPPPASTATPPLAPAATTPSDTPAETTPTASSQPQPKTVAAASRPPPMAGGQVRNRTSSHASVTSSQRGTPPLTRADSTHSTGRDPALSLPHETAPPAADNGDESEELDIEDDGGETLRLENSLTDSRGSGSTDKGASNIPDDHRPVSSAGSGVSDGSGVTEPPEHPARRALWRLCTHPFFSYTIMGFIVFNTILLAIEHHNQPQSLADFLYVANIVLTVIFAIELVIKMIGLGPRGYVRDRFNIFDAIIVLVSIIELIVGGGGAVSVFRAFRLMRVFKLIRSWDSIRQLLEVIVGALAPIGNAAFVLLLFIFIFAVLGMQLFGGNVRFEGEEMEVPRHNFDNFLWSIITVFQILTGENWNEVMYDVVRATHWSASLYFVVVVVIGNYVLLNLFQAILLQNFAVSHDDEDEEDGQQEEEGGEEEGGDQPEEQEMIVIPAKQPESSQLADTGVVPATGRAEKLVTPSTAATPSGVMVDVASSRETSPGSENDGSGAPVVVGPPASQSSMTTNSNNNNATTTDSHGNTMANTNDNDAEPVVSNATGPEAKTLLGADIINDQEEVRARRRNTQSSTASSSLQRNSSILPTGDEDLHGLPPLKSKSLFLFSPDSKFRVTIAKLVFNPIFEGVVIFFIAVSSVLLALENPSITKGSPMQQFLFISDVFFVSVFSMEMLLKIIALGFVLHEDSYLRSHWNKLDCFVVIVSVLTLTLTGVDIQFLRALRALRPLRVVSRSDGMRVVVYSLLRAIPGVVNVGMICLLFWVIFGILGVQLFAGKFYYCTDPTVANRVECETTDPVTFVPRGEWRNARSHFNHLAAALLSLFELSTLELWPQLMYQGVDAVGIDQQPQRDHNQFVSLYYVSFLVVGSFFALGLFVGVVIDNFIEIQQQFNGAAFLTPKQAEWVEAQRTMMKFRPLYVPPAPQNKLRLMVYNVVIHKAFDWFIVILIVFNILTMTIEHYDQPDSVSQFLFTSNIVFTVLFALELVAKVFGLGPKAYIASNWNRFDAFIVILSIFGFWISVGPGATLFRVFRIFRIFRLVKRAKGIRTLLQTLLYSIPTLWNVGSICLLLFFIYAVAGVSLFGKVKFGEFLNEHANFTHFGLAMLTLFRMATGESWNGIMHDCMVSEPECSKAEDNCGTSTAWIYFVSFMTLMFLVMVNLFIAVIIQNFSFLVEESTILSTDDYETFLRVWANHDPLASYYIPSEAALKFIRELPPPLGLGPHATDAQARRYLFKLEIPVYDNQIHFKDTMLALAQHQVGVSLPEDNSVSAEIARKWSKKFKTPDANQDYTIDEMYSAKLMQARWRAYVAKKKAERAKAKAKASLHEGGSGDGDDVDLTTPVFQRRTDTIMSDADDIVSRPSVSSAVDTPSGPPRLPSQAKKITPVPPLARKDSSIARQRASPENGTSSSK